MFSTGPKNPSWNATGRFIDEQGYVMVRLGLGHPLACKRAYGYEHVVVWVAAGNPIPGPDDTIDHINQVKSDNRIENLRLMTRADHARYHAADQPRNRGQFARRIVDAIAEAALSTTGEGLP